ncbi:MAG: SDR family NAD(P)-dependent oxidoreductase [Micromonosporaceae bacterium]
MTGKRWELLSEVTAMGRYQDRVALVTGGAHGIGAGIVRRLAGEGAAVVIADLEPEAGDRLAAELTGDALAVHCNVTDRASADAAIAAAVDRYGHLDLLVNNAGGSVRTGEFAESDLAAWHRQLDVTLVGAVHCVQAALPHLLASPYGGNVVSIGSVNGLVAFGDPAYSAAKAGLASLTQNLAARYAADGLRFNLVAPGTVRTRNWDDQPNALAALTATIPLGRAGEPADIAAAVAFLGSDDASWITGVVLRVDGGVLVGPAAAFFRDRSEDR